MKKNYPSNLTDNQYEAMLRIIGDKRKRQCHLRDVLNAILYILKSGCQWRM
ncbi:MAG: transposase, partial [Alistipes sp.]|nr:transposase [Alistipes sp.]